VNTVEAAGLSKRYRRTWALRDCTLAVPAGHVVALVGPNGAGKTTLLNLAVGLTGPTAGSVTVARLPAGRYWLFQAIEEVTGLLLALLLGAATVMLVRRRVAA
jgi:ABC-type multidrug transport system ATPase subunit